MGASDAAAWAEMRAALWPGEKRDGLRSGALAMLASNEAWAFLAETQAGEPVGFAEVEVRKYANGCESMPVPFLEAIFVQPRFRRRGVGRALIGHIRGFLVARGFRELGSDALIDNHVSHEAHRGWGFSETERVVYFRQSLVDEAR
jgi:aminoglycoside 6'-N-acetyltransferase I